MEVPGKCLKQAASSHLCEPCKVDDVSKQAGGFCKDCKQCMCDDCFRQHIRLTLCKDHTMVGLDCISKMSIEEEEVEEEVETCRKHAGEKVKFYCRQHQAVGCGDCMVNDHVTCKPEYIKEIANDFCQSNLIKKKVQELVSDNKKKEDEIFKRRQSNATQLKTVINDIKQFRQDMERYLQRTEEKLLQEAEQIIATNEKLLADVEQVCQQVSTKLQIIQDILDANSNQNMSLFIHLVECKSGVSDIETTMKKKQPTITFVPESQLTNLMSEVKTFGKLQVAGSKDMTDIGRSIAGNVTVKDGSSSSAALKFPGVRPIKTEENDDIVFETFYHRSGKEFQCIYQSGMRFYLDDFGSQDWQPFPKRWYNEGQLVTNAKDKMQHKQRKMKR